MESLDLDSLLGRNEIAKEIEIILNNFDNTDMKYKKGIYIYGNNGIGKTKFILNLLKRLNYDVIYYDNSVIRNKTLIDNICNSNLSNRNVYSMFLKEQKKMVIVIDDINGMNYGDKNGIISLIKLIRYKKTKKQKLENITSNPIICINNNSNDKKILELKKVCNVFELLNPKNDELIEIINKLLPNIFKYSEMENKLIRENILLFLNNMLVPINKIIFYEKNDLIYKKFYKNCVLLKSENENIKNTTKNFLENKYTFNDVDNILESERTILALLFHENVIQLIDNKSLLVYLKILDNFIFSDYIDRIIFQKQIWQLTEINYIIKLFYNNFILGDSDLLNNNFTHDIIFTKVLTKYSSEYNNYIFIYNLLQAFLLDKIDVFIFFYKHRNTNINDIIYMLEPYNVSKLEIMRIIKLVNQLANGNIESEKNKDLDSIDYDYNVDKVIDIDLDITEEIM
tara:strand:- start:1090 stop:2454 length:1365 start_codon:yes stop_codon:yes gene_type:complete